MISQIINVFVLGMVGGFIPGPILTMTFSEGVRAGWKAGVKIIFYALFAESIVAGVIFSLLSFLDLNQSIFKMLSLVGGLLLFYFAYKVFSIKSISLEAGDSIFTLKKIFLLTILNGGFFIFWITVCAPLAVNLSRVVSGGLYLFLAAFEIGWLVAMAVVLGLALFARRWINNEKRLKIFLKFIAICLALFGLRMIYGVIVK
jgi:threonine/homoserine/homoserine lactone efflux protein